MNRITSRLGLFALMLASCAAAVPTQAGATTKKQAPACSHCAIGKARAAKPTLHLSAGLPGSCCQSGNCCPECPTCCQDNTCNTGDCPAGCCNTAACSSKASCCQ